MGWAARTFGEGAWADCLSLSRRLLNQPRQALAKLQWRQGLYVAFPIPCACDFADGFGPSCSLDRHRSSAPASHSPSSTSADTVHTPKWLLVTSYVLNKLAERLQTADKLDLHHPASTVSVCRGVCRRRGAVVRPRPGQDRRQHEGGLGGVPGARKKGRGSGGCVGRDEEE